MSPEFANSLSRRSFLGKSAATLAGAAVVSGVPSILRGAPDTKVLKIALVGCGGRGTGACSEALKADPHVQLAYMADIFAPQIDKALQNLKAGIDDPAKVDEAKVQKFVGLDAIDKVVASDVDVVLLTTPPGFRAEHFEKVVKAGKHAFAEKPVCVDGPTYQRFMAAARESKEKGLAVQSGFCWRADLAERATQKRIRDGVIGEIVSTFGTYIGNSPWVKKRDDAWTDLEYQLRNWMYFAWLSGDHIVEQAVHTVDKMCWSFNDVHPIACVGTGGRQQRVEEQYGHVYDHFSVVYEYPGGGRGNIFCRQQQGCFNQVGDIFHGTKGRVEQISGTHNRMFAGDDQWKFEDERNNKYQTEHDEFFASIRAGKPLNFAEKLADSSMVAVMGRMSAYTGQRITWEDAIASTERLAPEKLDWNMKLSIPPVAMPGRTKFV